MGAFSIGQSVSRREDPRLLKGHGRFYDDLKLPDQLFASIVRSPHAHADIRRIDTAAALVTGINGKLFRAAAPGDIEKHVSSPATKKAIVAVTNGRYPISRNMNNASIFASTACSRSRSSHSRALTSDPC